ncbi:MAG: phosphomannomutase/phosphoglucomutase [Candidatus Aminicenantes bacterium]|nr:phosphomannomutase/phosphoglucomutase [Candidatus Aminicenantes bacterium]
MEVKPHIFREYDIRGIVDKDLDSGVVETLGRAMGTYFRRDGRRTVAVGRDCRLSSPGFFTALARGLQATGCAVVDLGVVPTPLLYFSIFHKGYEAGVMVTGSHNPPDQNGFKLMSGRDTLYGPAIQELYGLIRDRRLVVDTGGSLASYAIVPEYTDYVLANIKPLRKLRVVVDAGNGTAGVVAVPIFRRLGCDVTELYCDMDGRFPNHHPDPTLPEAMEILIKTVRETGADLGIAYDGDGDRIGAVDDQGRIVWGDQLMIVFSRDVLARHPGAAVISEVKASKTLYEEVAKLGGRPIMWKTGHSLIKKKIKDEKALLAGEMSGHIFFADRWFGFDDAIYSSARLLEILSGSELKLSAMLADLPKTFSTPEVRVYASEEVKFKIVDEVRRELAKTHEVVDIDGVRAVYPRGWGLVRASNTQAVLVLRFEADTPEDLDAIQKDVRGILESVIMKLEPNAK